MFRSLWLILPVIASITLSAQDPAIPAAVVASGGGTSSGATFTLTGTIGQPVAGTLSGGSYTLTGGVIGALLRIELPDPDGTFYTWMENLPAEQLPPPRQRGPEDTPANDGISNLLKYALGLLPLVPAADAMPQLVAEGRFLAIELVRAKDRGVAWQLRFSQDLEQWTDAPFTVVVVEDFGDTERIRLVSDLTAADNPKTFLLLRLDML